MLIQPARIVPIHNEITPAIILNNKDMIIPATIIHEDIFFILKDFIYKIKPLIEDDLGLNCYSNSINISFIYSDTKSIAMYKVDPNSQDRSLYNIFTIFINRYALDKFYKFKSIDKYLTVVFIEFIRIMREIYHYILIYCYGYSDEYILDDLYTEGYTDEDVLSKDIDNYSSYIFDKFKSDKLLEKIIQSSNIAAFSQSPIIQFNIPTFINIIINSSDSIQRILEYLNISMLISFQNWYLNDNDTMYIVDYDVDRDVCIIKYNCNIDLQHNQILDYVKRLIIYSIMDIYNEINNCMNDMQILDSYIWDLSKDIEIIFYSIY